MTTIKSFSMPDELYNQVKELANELKISASNFVVRAIQSQIENLSNNAGWGKYEIKQEVEAKPEEPKTLHIPIKDDVIEAISKTEPQNPCKLGHRWEEVEGQAVCKRCKKIGAVLTT